MSLLDLFTPTPAPAGRCWVIAEIGVNHNGDVGLAREMVDAAAEVGADAVKFQTFSARRLATAATPKVSYQTREAPPDESHIAMLEALELSPAGHEDLLAHCQSRGVEFLSTPYGVEDARYLDGLGVRLFKTASADIVDLWLQEFIAGTGKPVLMATGMASMDEIKSALAVYGSGAPSQVALLHCVSNYPCSDESLNLAAVTTLRETFGTPVGYSDHSVGHQAAVMAYALGARVVEKHFTLDRDLPGPDHRASSTPEEFSELVDALHRAETMFGSPGKQRQPEEQEMAAVSRKSLTLATDVEAGHRIRAEDLALKRPGTGIAAAATGEVVGRVVRRALPADHQLAWEDLES